MSTASGEESEEARVTTSASRDTPFERKVGSGRSSVVVRRARVVGRRGAKLLGKCKTGRSVFSHVAMPSDVGNVKFVFNAVVAVILEEKLKASGHY